MQVELVSFVDWRDVLVGIKELAVAGAAICAAWAAWLALSTWKQEAVWREDRDLARRIMLSVLAVDDGFRHVRNPFQSSGEYPDDATSDAHHSSPERRRVQAHIYDQRMGVLLEPLRELDTLLREAEIVWESETDVHRKELREVYGALRWQVSRHVASQDPRDEDPFDFSNRDDGREMRQVIYQTPSQSRHEDEFGDRINAVLESVREWCRPKIARP